MRSSGRGHIAPVPCHGPFQGRRGRSRWREQGFDKAPGLVGIQLDLIALIDDLVSRFTPVHNDELGHRASFEHGRFLKKLFVILRDACDKSLALSCFHHRLHD